MSSGPVGWQLDEWDTASALDVDVAGAAADDVPWPKMRTPDPDELAIDLQRASRLSGFGVPPSHFVTTPLYFLRALRARRALKEARRQARQRLAQAERTRDEHLANLAAALQPQLANRERFAALYAPWEEKEAAIERGRQAIEHTDLQSAQQLMQLEAELVTARSERDVRQRQANQACFVKDRAGREVARTRAALKRLEIEIRNVGNKARELAPVGAPMPVELAPRYASLRSEAEQVKAQLDQLVQDEKRFAQAWEQARDQQRRAVAALQAVEAKKQALAEAQAGRLEKQMQQLQEARDEKTSVMAEAGRAIVELRGEVPVEPETRRVLLASDEAVHSACHELWTWEAAVTTLDESAYTTGRNLLIALALALLGLLLWVVI